MGFHQIHYFVYCYVIFFLIITQMPSHIYLSGLVFSIGWVSYILSEPVLKHFNKVIVLVGGHFSLVILLGLIALIDVDSIAYLIVMWFLTGFGGGTVFCLRISNQELPKHGQVDMEIWEDLGHVAGVLMCITIAILTNDLKKCFVVASMMAFLTATMYLSWIGYQQKTE
jgi:hypothetical protein